MKYSSSVRRIELANGTRVIVDPAPGFRSAAVLVALNGGSRDELPHQIGLTHLLEHLLFKRTSNLSPRDIANRIDELGGRINASTDVDSLCLYGNVQCTDVESLLFFFSQLLRDPQFTERDLKLEKEIIRQEILETEDDSLAVTFREFNERFWPSATLGMPVFGYPEVLAEFNSGDVKARLNDLLVGTRIIVCVAGAVNVDSVLSQIEDLFGSLPRGASREVQTPTTGSGVFIVPKPVSQTHLVIGQRWTSLRDADYLAGLVVATVLGDGMSSRLFRSLRESHGLAYDVSSSVDSYADTGVLLNCVTLEKRNVEFAQKLLLAEVTLLKQDFLQDDEFTRTIKMMVAQVEMQHDELGARTWRALETEILFGRCISIDEIVDRLKALSMNDVRAVIDQRLLVEHGLMVLGGDVDKTSVIPELQNLCGETSM